MRRTFGELQTTSKDYISQALGSFASSTVANFIKEHLNEGMHTIQRELRGYIQLDLPKTALTVDDQQRYHYPPDIYPPIEAATLEMSDVVYDLQVVSSQKHWNALNQIDFSGTTIPQYIFPMRDHFEIWPIPQADGDTITLYASLLDRDMTAEDYTTGSVTVTNNDATITGAGTTFTSYMAGRWFKSTVDPTFYRITTFTDATHFELETVWEGITGAAQAYTVGEIPEIPPELHNLLPHYVAGMFYSGPRNNFDSAQKHLNFFWTGDFANEGRSLTGSIGGVLGAKQRYSKRSDSKVINKGGNRWNKFDERWSSTLSSTI